MKTNLDMKQVTMYLKRHGIPQNMVESIRIAMTQDAVQNGNDIQTDRIFILLALVLHDCYGMGQKRIIKGLQMFDDYCGRIADDLEWKDIMKELHDKTGLIVRTNEGNRLIFEYSPNIEV